VYFAGRPGHTRERALVVPSLIASFKDAWPSPFARTGNAGWMLGSLWLALTAYNLFKPYHIDDTAHLEIARWIAADPLHPMSGTVYWTGGYQPIYLTNQPHLYFYLLALWGSLVGYGEPAMHMLQACFTLAAILLCYRIALRLVPAQAAWVTGMLAFSPSFAVEQNLMLDVPLLALWLLFFSALIVGANAQPKAQTRRFLVAALACSAALLVKYSSLVLLVILLAVIIYERRWQYGWAVLIPLVVLGAWSLFNVLDYGAVHIAQREPGLQQGVNQSLRRLVDWALTLGAITPLGLITIVQLVPWLHRRRRWIYAVTAVFSVLLVAGVASGNIQESLADRVLRAAFLGNAAGMAVAVTLAGLRRLPTGRSFLHPSARNSQLLILLLWITGHMAFYSLFAPFMAARHLLLVLPAVLLMGALLWRTRLARAHAVFGFAASVALSGALGWSDWHFAAFFRDEAAAIRATLPGDARIWFTGHWGWQWYAERNGFSGVDVRQLELAPGDFLIIPLDVNREFAPSVPPPPPLTLLRTDRKPLGIGDIFCTADPARFYMTDFLESPWRLTRSCSNTVLIYRVGV
jgi:4-amino-4-deoxy-L-arabinose transferase-like glycosyltransferase